MVEKASLSARMHLTTESIFQTILNKLHFLAQIQPKNIMKEDSHWFTEDIFSNVFKFTQLLSSGQTGYDTMCTPFLYLRSGNSSVCKLRSTIRFSPIACSTLIAQMFPVYNWNNNSFVETLSKLPRHEVFSFIANGSQSVYFPAVNSAKSKLTMISNQHFKIFMQALQ